MHASWKLAWLYRFLSIMLCIQMNGDEEPVAERGESNHGDQENAREGEGGDTNDSETERSESPEDEGQGDKLLS